MRGKIFHEHMIEVLKKTSQRKGFQARRQVPSKKGKKAGWLF